MKLFFTSVFTIVIGFSLLPAVAGARGLGAAGSCVEGDPRPLCAGRFQCVTPIGLPEYSSLSRTAQGQIDAFDSKTGEKTREYRIENESQSEEALIYSGYALDFQPAGTVVVDTPCSSQIKWTFQLRHSSGSVVNGVLQETKTSACRGLKKPQVERKTEYYSCQPLG